MALNPDVVTTCIAANSIKNGTVMTFIGGGTNGSVMLTNTPVKKLSPSVNKVPVLESVENTLKDRLDEVNYY